MSIKDFYDKVTSDMQNNGIDFKTEEQIQEQILIQNEENLKKIEDKKKQLLIIAKNIESKVKIRVTQILPEQLSLKKEQIHTDMELTMVLHCNVINDIFDLQRALEEMRVVQNSLLCLLHHNLKFKNKIKLRGTKELDTYIASDYTYNEINMKIKSMQYMIEKSNNYSRLISQKLGFLKEIQKDITAQRFREKIDG